MESNKKIIFLSDYFDINNMDEDGNCISVELADTGILLDDETNKIGLCSGQILEMVPDCMFVECY